ncbi:hydrolase [Enterobacteriaceae bacterium BIT-l23]|uniref:isochorismate family cysteine hydrolase YcaC n=1 Tax=Jejubacter sp. L23 TaxID=3092086 RepID=UPI0015848E9B|nr:hydrolase [Enterobacteriaceae bacterium BIT-l23]
MSKPYVRLDKDNAAVLFVDHQSGLFNITRDYNPDQLKNRVIGLADLAKFFDLPVILTTSFENGPNGPMVPELVERFPDAPFIPRPGQINAWDNEDFVKAVKETGKKQLIIAGVVTEVCVAFVALSALAEGYEVFVIADASATFDEISRETALDRVRDAGGQILTWFAAAGELQRDWRNDMEGFANILGPHIAPYANLMQSFSRVQKDTRAE